MPKIIKGASGKARSGGGPNMNKNVKVTPTGGSPNTRKVSMSGAAHIGRSVGNHVMGNGGREVKRNDPPLYTEARAAVPMGNEVAKNVQGGGPGKGYVNHGPSGTQGQHGPVAGTVEPQGRDILSDFSPGKR